MKKVIVLVLVLALIGGGYLAYQRWVSSQFDAWQYIPNNQLLVLESNAIQASPTPQDSARVNLDEAPVLSDAVTLLKLLKEVTNDKKVMDNFLKGKSILYSLHPDGESRLKYICYIPFHPAKDKVLLDQLTQGESSKGFRIFSHSLDNITIWQLFKGKSQYFTFVLHDNYLIYSQSTPLIEDVIRNVGKLIKKDLVLSPIKTYQFQQGAFANIFLNTANVNRLAQKVMSNDSDVWLSVVQMLTSAQDYNVKVGRAGKSITIEAQHDHINDPFLRLLAQQETGTIKCPHLIPNQTASFLHIHISDPFTFQEDTKSYIKQSSPSIEKLREQAQDDFDINLDSLFSYMGSEVALCKLSATNESNALLIIKASSDKLFKWFVSESSRISTEQQRVTFKETYLSFPIRQIPFGLPTLAFGRWVGRFSQCFVAQVGNYVLMSDNLESLKNSLADININNVWSNSGPQIANLRRCKAAQMTILVQPEKGWELLNQQVSSQWARATQRTEADFMSLQSVGIQFLKIGQHLHTQIELVQADQQKATTHLNQFILQKQVILPSSIISAPYLYPYGQQKTPEILVQTANKSITALQSDGTKVGNKQLQDIISSNVRSVDFRNTGSLQHICATGNRLVSIERNEDGLFVQQSDELKGVSFKNINLLKNGNILTLSDQSNKYYSLDNQFKNIKPLANSQIHLSYVLSPIYALNAGLLTTDIRLQSNGKLHLNTNAGVPLAKSPIDLGGLFDSSPYIETDSETGGYVMRMISRQGELITMKLNGEIVNKLQLVRPVKTSEYKLLPSAQYNDWLLIRLTANTLTLMNKKGEELLQFQNINPENYQLNYYNFGSDMRFLALKVNNETKIYDISGNWIGNKKMISAYPVSMAYIDSYKKLLVYVTKGNALEIWSVKIK
jgi:hypothetical protein